MPWLLTGLGWKYGKIKELVKPTEAVSDNT